MPKLSNRGLLTSLLCLGNVYVLCSSLLLAVLICVSRQCGPEGTGVDQNGMEKKIESVADDENLWMTNEVVDTERRMNE